MTYQLVVTLLVLLGLIISFSSKKLRMGVSVMTAVAVLALTGVIDVQTALSGFSSTSTCIVVTMFVMASALGKTSIVARIRAAIEALGDRNEAMLVAAMTVACFLLTFMVGQTACMCIMYLLAVGMPNKGRTAPSRLIFYACAINGAWFGRIPFGINLSLPATMNGFYSGIVEGHPEWQLGALDVFIAGVIPSIVLTIFCFLAIKLIPINECDESMLPKGAAQAETSLSKRDETIVIVLFFAMCAGFVLSSIIGDYQYLIPILCVLALYYFKIMTVQEIVRGLTGPMLWLVAGMSVVSTALSSSGATQLIGDTVLNIVGENPNPYFLLIVLGIATMIPANFCSHMGTFAIMCPIAASIAVAGGMNPVPLILMVNICGCSGIAFPSGCGAAMVAFGIGNHSPAKLLKFTLPYLVITLIAAAITIPMFFPLYD